MNNTATLFLRYVPINAYKCNRPWLKKKVMKKFKQVISARERSLCQLCVFEFRVEVKEENSIGDACTPQPGEIVFNTMRYISSETVQRSGYFQSSVSYLKLQKMFR